MCKQSTMHLRDSLNTCITAIHTGKNAHTLTESFMSTWICDYQLAMWVCCGCLSWSDLRLTEGSNTTHSTSINSHMHAAMNQHPPQWSSQLCSRGEGLVGWLCLLPTLMCRIGMPSSPTPWTEWFDQVCSRLVQTPLRCHASHPMRNGAQHEQHPATEHVCVSCKLTKCFNTNVYVIYTCSKPGLPCLGREWCIWHRNLRFSFRGRV